jgi:hypothetical protein
MLLKSLARHAFFPGFLILMSIVHAGCSSEPTVKYASDAPQATAAPTPVPTPNPDQAAGLLTRFYRDVDSGTKDSIADIGSIVSPDFVRNHHDDWSAAYGFIHDPKVQITGVKDRTVNYSLDYDYFTAKGGKLFWERTGRWTFNRGTRSGWVLDGDAWNSVHIVAISMPNDANATHVQDTVFSDGRHEFEYQGQRYSFLAKGDAWKITAVSTPPPPPPTDAEATTGSSYGSTGAYTQTAAQAYAATAAAAPEADCEEVGVQDIYDDGKILALDDGRHLSVSDVDTVTSSVWVAPFDGLICHGDRFINKDDNEAVDLAD